MPVFMNCSPYDVAFSAMTRSYSAASKSQPRPSLFDAVQGMLPRAAQ